MPAHADILEQHDSIAKPFLGSVVFHAAVFGLLVLAGYTVHKNRVVWGFQNAGGGPASVAVNPVNSIPLPQRSGHVNPLANDTESRLPQQVTKPLPQPRVKPPEPDAIPLKGRNRERVARQEIVPNRYHPDVQPRPNQVYSREAPALVSPMIAKSGSGQIGVGPNGPLGTQCGAYASQIQQLVASKWQTGMIDARIQSAPPVIFSFNLHRDGSVEGLQKKQSSGNYEVDTSAQRALSEAIPFPPISCTSNGGQIEFWFQLKR